MDIRTRRAIHKRAADLIAALAVSNGLKREQVFVSGGSDYHGANKPHITIGKGKGDLEIPYSVLDGLRARHAEIYGK